MAGPGEKATRARILRGTGVPEIRTHPSHCHWTVTVSFFFPIEMFPSALGGVVRYAQSSRIDMGRSPKGITRKIDLHAPSPSET